MTHHSLTSGPRRTLGQRRMSGLWTPETGRRKSHQSRMIIKEGITSTGQALEKAKTLFRHDPARKQVLVLITGKL